MSATAGWPSSGTHWAIVWVVACGEHEPDEPLTDEPQLGKPRLMLKLGQARGPAGVINAHGLTPVMTRLSPGELETSTR
jgi:hypothetical protein